MGNNCLIHFYKRYNSTSNITMMSTSFQPKSKVFIDPDEGWRRQVYFDAEVDIVPSHWLWFDEEDDGSLKWLDGGIDDEKDTLNYDKSDEKNADTVEHVDDNTRKCGKRKKDQFADKNENVDDNTCKCGKSKKAKLADTKFDDNPEVVEVNGKDERKKTKIKGIKCNVDDNTGKCVKSKKDKLVDTKFDDKAEQVGVKDKAERMKTKVNGSKCRSPVKSRPPKFYTTIMNCVVQLIIGNVADGRIKSPRKALSDSKIENVVKPVEKAEDALDRLPLNVSDIRKQFMSGNKSKRSEHHMDSKNDRKTETRQSKANKDSAGPCKSGKVKALSAIFDEGKVEEVAALDPLKKNKVKEHRPPRRLMG